MEFCIINMQKWSNFMKESIKYSRILWNLKQILQYSQKHSPKGHMVKLFSDVTKNLFYDKSFFKKFNLYLGLYPRKSTEMGQKWILEPLFSEI